ncbi:MAG: hypothetical protein FJW69_07440 [Actinobacteria bacterium]|nr:hypothetical protein [Actinomycetota bacterium]
MEGIVNVCVEPEEEIVQTPDAVEVAKVCVEVVRPFKDVIPPAPPSSVPQKKNPPVFVSIVLQFVKPLTEIDPITFSVLVVVVAFEPTTTCELVVLG